MLKRLLPILFLLLQGIATLNAASSTVLEDLVKVFEENPSNHQTAIQLLKELDKQGMPNQKIIDHYFSTQQEADYFKEYNWTIVRDFVSDINAPQLKFVFLNYNKFIQYYSKDDVFQKLDNVLVSHLDYYYRNDKRAYEQQLNKMREGGYEHYDIISDYFYIRQLRVDKRSEDYFYKARKLFRYFPEDRQMIKEITAGALEIMDDVSRLKVIQLWAGKTVEKKTDFDALYNYALISEKCGFEDIAQRYTHIAGNLALQSKNKLWQQRVVELRGIVQ